MDIEKFEQEINILEEAQKERKQEIKKIEEKIEEKNEIEKNEIKNKYKNEINIIEIENIINKKNINNELEENQNKLNQYIIINHELELEQKNIILKLKQLPEIEEEIELLKDKYNELINKRESINLVKRIFENSYVTMKQNITPSFIKELSGNMAKISNNKYNNIKLDDQQGLIVELKNGSYITADRLSVGTIDQLYVSLRLAVLQELISERLPIIFDETFAYFDDNRLEEILEYLYEKYNNQILIFTCTKREIEILKKINIKYNLIEIK